MGNCWTWDQYTGMLTTLKAAYDNEALPGVIIASMTMLTGFFGINGGGEQLKNADDFAIAGIAMLLTVAIGSMAGMYVGASALKNSLKDGKKISYVDYGGSALSQMTGIIVTLNIGLFLGAAAILVVAPFYLVKDVMANFSGKDAYTLMTMGTIVAAGEFASAYSLEAVSEKMIGWFLNYDTSGESYDRPAATNADGEDNTPGAGLALIIDVLNHTLIMAGYFIFAILCTSATLTYGHFILTAEEDWTLPYIGDIWPISLLMPFIDAAMPSKK